MDEVTGAEGTVRLMGEQCGEVPGEGSRGLMQPVLSGFLLCGVWLWRGFLLAVIHLSD